ncbi:MAG: hypothetical protein AAGI52_12395 [Bacteroidota bacterium]
MYRSALVLLAALVAFPAQSQTCPAALADERAPLVSGIAGDDAAAQEALAEYLCTYRAEALNTTDDLLRALTLRDTLIARLGPRVEGWFFADEEQRYAQMEAFYEETESLALQPVQAEGMLFGLTTGPLMDGLVTTLAPSDLALYLDFVEAEGSGEGGEYPFGWLDAEIRMILAGESLRRDFPASPYVAKTQEAYSRALLTLASLHPVPMDGMDSPTWFAGVGTSDFYPWASDAEALPTFVEEAEQTGSRYHAPFAALLADPPMADGGELEVIVIGDAWSSREDAEARALALLDAGQDIAGPMRLGESWYVVYRYYPTGDARLQPAFERAEEAGLQPRQFAYEPEVY